MIFKMILNALCSTVPHLMFNNETDYSLVNITKKKKKNTTK